MFTMQYARTMIKKDLEKNGKSTNGLYHEPLFSDYQFMALARKTKEKALILALYRQELLRSFKERGYALFDEGVRCPGITSKESLDLVYRMLDKLAVKFANKVMDNN